MKTSTDLRKVIRECAKAVAEDFSGVEYLESNFRRMLARTLRRRGLKVYEEIVVPYLFEDGPDKIPFGWGFVDIAVWDEETTSAVILELKIQKKSAERQLKKYLRHWTYSPVLFGMTLNFFQDDVIVSEYCQKFRADRSAGAASFIRSEDDCIVL